MILIYTIPGRPLGKPRQTQRDRWKQRPCVMAYRAWADAARLCCHRRPDADQIHHVDVIANFAPPPSWSRRRRQECIGQPMRSKPDLDNILKAVLDALWGEDQQIPSGACKKIWAESDCLELKIHTTPNPTGEQ